MEDVRDVFICRKHLQEHGNYCIGAQTVDRKLDLLIEELKRYSVSVAGIQEIRCVMCGLVAERTVGHARQEKPDWFLESTDILMPLLQMKMKRMKECYRTTVYQMVRSSVGSKEWRMS